MSLAKVIITVIVDHYLFTCLVSSVKLWAFIGTMTWIHSCTYLPLPAPDILRVHVEWINEWMSGWLFHLARIWPCKTDFLQIFYVTVFTFLTCLMVWSALPLWRFHIKVSTEIFMDRCSSWSLGGILQPRNANCMYIKWPGHWAYLSCSYCSANPSCACLRDRRRQPLIYTGFLFSSSLSNGRWFTGPSRDCYDTYCVRRV